MPRLRTPIVIATALGFFFLTPLWDWFRRINQEIWSGVAGYVEFLEANPFVVLLVLALGVPALLRKFK